jgi:hypothetical protein
MPGATTTTPAARDQLALSLTPPPPSVREGTHAAWATRSDTSREGAAHVQRDLGARQAAVLAVLRSRPSTIHEVATALGIPDHSASGRIRELTLLGRIEQTAERRKNPSGVRAAVWRVRP